MAKPLTAISVAKARAGADRREIPDPGCRGLYLIVQPSGVKSWAARYRIYRRPAKLTLGPALVGARAESAETPQVGAPLSLAAARELCAKVLREAQAGHDPAQAKREKRARQHAAEADSFRHVAEEFLRQVGPTLRSCNQRRADLELFYPALGSMPLDQIKRVMFIRVLDNVADTRGPVRADRALGAAKRLLAWHAERSDYAPVLTRGGRRTKTAERARKRVLGDDELRRVWLTAERFGVFGDLVRFLLLTAARRTEAAGLRRSELGLVECVVKNNGAENKEQVQAWTIPATRNKSKSTVVIPLSKAAQAIIAARPGLAGGDHVFSVTGRKAFADFSHSKAAFDKAAGVAGWTIHDLRRTARTLLSRGDISNDVAEMCLGHSIGALRKTYDQFEYVAKKRHAVEALAAEIERIVRPQPDVVVPIKRPRRK